MSRNLLPLTLAVALFGTGASGDVPKVAVDVAPAHSLVARVMQGVGAPSLVVAPGASPHAYSLRPSNAAVLQEADLVFWVGPELTPWLEDAIVTLAGDAAVAALLDLDGTMVLQTREAALFETHSHDGHDDDTTAGGYEDEDAHADRAQVGRDPHAWLHPGNAAVWLDAIAADLAAADPENADRYRANAAAGKADLAALRAEIEALLAPVRGHDFIVFHDAYRYFELAFDMPAAGAISLSDATTPGPARIAGIRRKVAALGVTCVLSEPQFDPGVVETVLGGTGARTAVLDPLGSDLEPGPALYPRLMRSLATALAGCL